MKTQSASTGLVALLLFASLSLVWSISMIGRQEVSLPPTISQVAQVGGGVTNGLVGWWKFDEGTGTTASDSSGSGNTGTLTSGPIWKSGMAGTAVSLDGTNDHVKVASASGLNFSNGQTVTVAFWAKPARMRTCDGFVTGGTWGIQEGCGTNSQVSFYYYNDSAGWILFDSPTGKITLNTWVHITVSYTFGNGSSAKIYVNGQPVSGTWSGGSGNGNDALSGNTGAVVLGYAAPSELYKGLLDDVRVYNRALSAAEVAQIYAEPSGGPVTPPPATDTTAPSVPANLSASAVSSSQINLSWTASTDAVGVTGYKVFRNGTQVGTPTATTYSDTGLTANTSYSYTVSANDAAGNTSAQSASVSATTQTAQANTYTVTVSKAGTGTGTVTSSQGGINCGSTCTSSALNSGTSVTLTAVPTTGSTFTSWSGGCSGTATTCSVTMNANKTVTATFTLTPVVDTTAPSVPANLSASAVSSSQINLTWSASTDAVGVTGYKVFRNGTQVGTPTATTYSDTGLTANTSYSYTVSANDAAGNTSAQSASVSATTQGAVVLPTGGGSPLANGILPANRSIDWSRAGVPGGIPNRTTICSTINATTYGNGTTDASTVINTAIKNCPANQVVYLPAGTFLLNNPIDFDLKSNITLRGAGPGKTILKPKTYTAITSGQTSLSPKIAITGGATKGSTSITVNNASGISPGTLINIFEANDPDFVWSRWGATDELIGQYAMVKSVSGNTLQLEDPLVWTYNLNPRLTYEVYPGMKWGGVEDLSITADSVYDGSMIQFWFTYASWIKNVETSWGNGNEHVFLHGCLRNEVRDSYIHDTYSTTDGYGLATVAGSDHRGGCTGLLIENNVFSGLWLAIILETEVGSVINYNYSQNMRVSIWPTYQVPDFNTNHGAHGMMDLFEGNVGTGFQNDGYHGSTSHITLFRNWLTGNHVDPAHNGGNIKTVDLTRFSYYHNVIGNILGASNFPMSIGKYEMTGEPGYNEQAVIYRLGYPNMGNNGYSLTNPPSNADDGGLDPKVKATLMRWGNYDYFNKTTLWNTSDIPSGVTAPSSHVLPPSLFYSSKPSWWPSSVAWPPFGPDISPMTNKIPAQLCLEQGKMPNCLTSGTTPPPTTDTTAPTSPTNLTATAISSSQIDLAWTASTDAVGVTGYRIYKNGATTPSATVTSGTTYSDTGLTANTSYSYAVSGYDAAGNESTKTMVTATTLTTTTSTKFMTNDRVQVTGGVLNVRSTPSTSGTLLGSQAVGILGTVIGGPTYANNYWWWNVNFDTGVDGWSVEDNLTKYTAVADTTAPSVPTNLSASAVSSSQINLTWSASTDAVGVTGYKVFRNGTQVGTPTATTYSDTGLTANTSYSYTVSAYDAAGNNSAQSASVSATTQVASVAGMIPADRLASWQGNVGVEGGIPNRTTICSTLNPGATAAQINTALTNCPDGQVVYLNAGTYSLTQTISMPSNKTLRGAGPDTTILLFTADLGQDINIANGFYTDYSDNAAININSGYTKDSSQLVLANTTGLATGDFIYISELNDPSIPVDITGAQACDFCGIYGAGAKRVRFQLSKITAINGTTVTITPPMYFAFSSTLSPQVHRAPSYGNKYVQFAGVENLTVKNGGTSVASTRVNIQFQGAANSWVKNVKLDTCGKRCIDIYVDVYKNEVRDSYFTKCLDRVNSDTCYGVQVWNGTANLVENNIFDNTANGVVTSSAVGNVFAYNYMYGAHRTASLTDWFWPDNWTHGSHSSYNLWEGNDTNGLEWDLYWGSNSHNMAYRNRFHGKDETVPYDLLNLQAVGAISTFPNNNYMTDIGNVLGTSGWNNMYEDRTEGPAGNRAVWRTPTVSLGFNTTKAFTTTLRHMNFDYFTNSVKKCSDAGEPGCQGGDGSTTLKASYYLGAKPAWFGSLAYPPIGPDVAGYTTDIPAKYCFSRGLMPNCLVSGTPPPTSDTTAPTSPTNLTATAISSSQIDLAWTASTDPSTGSGQVPSGVTGYRIYKNGATTPSATVTSGTTYSDTGLTANTSYSYAVSGYDAAGNESTKTMVTATTLTTTTSTKFTTNDRVQVTGGTLNVRSTPSTSGTLLGSQAVGILGTVIGGPTYANNYWWWNVNFDTGVDGWSVEDNLVKYQVTTIVPICGNNIVEAGEVCDSTNVNNLSCSSLPGYKSGSLSCKSDCSGYVATQCIAGSAVNVASCSDTSIQTVINTSVDGDTIVVPSGSCTWTGGVTITNKNIVIQGAGSDKTFVTDNTGTGSNLITVNSSQGKPFRITGFTFSNLNGPNGIESQSLIKNFRIDHNRFDSSTSRAVQVGNQGLVDHNTFENTYTGVAVFGDDATSWSRAISLGTGDAVYVEDNTFLNSNFYGDGTSDSYNGARWVFRNNSVTDAITDNHGLDSGGGRGTHSFEFYNNNFTFNHSLSWFTARFRSGSGVIFNNSITGLAENASRFGVVNYRSCQAFSFGICNGSNPIDGNQDATGYPCKDQIGRTTDDDSNGIQNAEPVYAWNNIVNGSSANVVVDPICTAVTNHIKENRDFFNGTQKSGYKSYIYPHPLTQLPSASVPPTSDTTAPTSPTNLTATAISSSQINLAWTASTDPSTGSGQVPSGVTGYKIYRGGTQIGTSTVNTYSNTGLTANTSYAYTVSAYDAAGNISAQSTSVSATTQVATLPSAGGSPLASGILPADRSIDWSYAGVPGGIPNRTTNCVTTACNTLWSGTVTTASINNAIASAPANTVVRIPAGTYSVDAINLGLYSNITLRGAGPGVTILNSTASGGGNIYTEQYGWTAGTSIVSGYTKGSTSITVSNASGFTVGNLIKVDQNDDTSFVMSTDGPKRNMAFTSRITAVNGNTITIATPLPYTLSAALSPQAYYLNGGPGISWTGVEDMTINNIGGANNMIYLAQAYASWIKNVELIGGENTFAFFVDSFQCELRDSYIHTAKNFPNNSDGYGVYVYYTSSFIKVENNIFDSLFVGILQSGASANAYLYNLNRNGVGYNWGHQVGIMNANHGAHPMMNLWEGNVGEQWQSDGYHGSASHETLFRNWINGIHPTNTDNRKMISAERASYYFNIIGNVLGSSWAVSTDPTSRYEMTGEPGYNEQEVIYRLGYPNMANNDSIPANPWPQYSLTYPDAKVKSTMMRWGNFDYYNNATRWNTGEVPSGVAVPASQTLPASFYYSSKPSWWPSSVAWPVIGPDVSGGNADPAGHANKIPAQVCFEQSKMPNCLTSGGTTPPPISTKFMTNDRVQVTGGVLNVRSTPSTSGTLLGSQATGALGTIIGGPTYANNYWWWNVNFDTGVDGWSVEDNLVKYQTTTSLIGGIISSDRGIDWSKAGVNGGIPVRTTICATLSPGTTAALINSAIQSCPSGQVVYLNAGTYNLSAGIDWNGKSNVTLRGAGPDQTILNFSAGSACRGMGADICIGAADNSYYIESPAHIADWTAGYAKGSTQLTLSNTTGLSAGMIIILDQLNDSADTGGLYVCDTGGVCADEGPGGGARLGRAQEQFVKVTAVNGNVVTITPHIYMPNWRASQSPQALWGNATGFVFGNGVEGLTVDNTNNNSGNRSNTYIIWCYDCYVKNIKSLKSDRNHVWLYMSAHSTVRDSYFDGTKNAASQSYGIESFMSSDNLVENNIFQHIVGGMIANASAPGTVYGYNYEVDDTYTTSPTWMQASNYLHGAGADMILHEGNDAVAFKADVIHGTHNFTTVFRNYFTGWETGKSAQTVPIELFSFTRFMNIVGNVLGTPAYHNTYESATPNLGNFDTSIYMLGHAGNLPTTKEDPLVKTTLLRWGNYDTVSNASRFVSGEVPSTLTQYGNPVPSSQTIPASLYLSTKPSWWPATVPFPPIGPDVTGGNVTGLDGHVNKIPAHICYDNATKDASGILINFNANYCYNGGTLPVSAPSIVAEPQSASSGIGATATFNVTVTGNPVPTYQWQKNGTNITGATSASYTTPTLAVSDNGNTYRVIVTNSQGSVTSSSATLTVTNTFTIGEKNILTGNDSGNGNLLLAQSTTLSQTATIQSLSFYVTSAAGKLRLGIYDATGPSGGPGAKKAETAEITPIVGWNTANVITQVALPAGTYWLAYLPSDSALYFATDFGSGSFAYYGYTYGALPATFSTSPSMGTTHWSFYATLAAGGTTPPPTLNKFVLGDRVQVTNTGTGLNVRSTPSTSGTSLGLQADGAVGTVTSVANQPTSANGYTWWNVNFDTGADGWVVEDYLVKYVASTATYDVVSCTQGETGVCRQPKDLTLANVQATVNASASSNGSVYGDGVYLKSGTVTWASSLNISNKKGLVVKGAGSANTVITLSGDAIDFSDADHARVTGINFVSSAGSHPITGWGKDFRVDHNIFSGSFSIGIWWIDGHNNTGLVDSNTFDFMTNGGTAVYVRDLAEYIESPIDFGSSNWVFVENNIFNSYGDAPEMVENQDQGKIVNRYNTYNELGGSNMQTIFEQHNTGEGGGGRAQEVYNNRVNFKSPPGQYLRMLYWRHGTGLVYNNIVDYSVRGTEPTVYFQLRAHRAAGGINHNDFSDGNDCANWSTNTANYSVPAKGTGMIAKCASTAYVSGSFKGEGYPAIGQPGQGVYGGAREPIYFWDNKKTADGTNLVNLTASDVLVEKTEQWAVQPNRDYCVSTTGKPSSCGGIALNYTPYTCPHPLTGLTGGCSGTAGTAGYNNTVTPPPTTTVNAASCSQTDVQNAINQASDGATVKVPAGTCTWTSTVTINKKAIVFQGAGIDQTMITRNTAVGETALSVTVPTSGVVTIRDLTFQTIPSAQWGIVGIGGGLRPSFRVTATKFIVAPTNYTVGTRALTIFDAYGVIDHSTFINTANSGQSVTLEGTGSATLTANWHTPQTYGDQNTVVIEDSVFTNTYQGDGALDAYDGTKFVFRHNQVNGTLVAWHGADSSPRAPRLFEIYQNIFTSNVNGPWVFIRSRGGTGVLWGNTMSGSSGFCLLSHYRASPTYSSAPGQSSDGNFDKSYPGQGYPTGYPLLDQVGRGSFASASIPNCTNGCTTAQYESLEPLYQWGNNYNGDTAPKCEVGNPAESASYIVAGRDFYDNLTKPGYIPLSYPHPLTGLPPITPPPTTDTTAPTAPTNLTATAISSSQIDLAWTASTDPSTGSGQVPSGVTGYRIYKNGATTPSATVTSGTTYSDTGLTANTSYSYAVSGYDAAGNESTKTMVTATTQNVVDITAPTVSITSPTSGNVAGTVNIAVTASDNVGVASVQLKLDGNNLGALLTTAPYSGTWDTTGVSIGTHILTAVATDLSGNITTSAGRSVTVANNVAPILANITNKSVNENVTLTFTVSATDANGDVLNYSANGLPSGASFDPATRSFNWIPSYTQAGVYSIVIDVDDGRGGSDNQTVTITVNNINRAPVVDAGPNQTVTLPSVVSLSGNASSDPDGNTLTYTWTKTSGPSVTISNPASVTTPVMLSGGAGTYVFTLNVSDGSLSAQDQVTVFAVNPTIPDADGDGVPDTSDKCVNTPSTLRTTVNAVGCPKPKSSKFTTVTDLSNVDLNAVDSFTVGNSYGSILFTTQNGPYSLVGTGGTTQLDIDSNINIEYGAVSLDSVAIPQLNKPATITLYNINIANPKIMRDDFVCDGCAIVSYVNHTFTFTVPSFSMYRIVSVDNTAPLVEITAPQNGSTVSSGSTVTLSASSSDSVGVQGVYYAANGSTISSVLTTSPYTATWQPPQGSYNIQAVARDLAGNYATSSSIALTVNAPVVVTPPPPSGGGGAPTGSSGSGGSTVGSFTPTVVQNPLASTTSGSSNIISPIIVTPSGIAITRALSFGSSGQDVIRLKWILTKAGYVITATTSPVFDISTDAALKKLQCNQGIVCSGTVSTTGYGSTGPRTRAVLTTLTAKYAGTASTPIVQNQQIPVLLTSMAKFTRALKSGSVGNDVKNLQIFLNANGFKVAVTGNGSPGRETTYFGPATTKALIRFQEANGKTILVPNGLTRGSGYFGVSTMKVVNGMIGK